MCRVLEFVLHYHPTPSVVPAAACLRQRTAGVARPGGLERVKRGRGTTLFERQWVGVSGGEPRVGGAVRLIEEGGGAV